MNHFVSARRPRAAVGVTAAAICLASGPFSITAVAAQAPGATPPGAPAPVTAPAVPPTTAPVTILAGTPVPLALKQRLRSGEVRKGDPVDFVVAADVRTADGQRVLIPSGTPARGSVDESRRAGAFGRPGRLRVRCEQVLLPDGTRVPLSGAPEKTGRSRRWATGITMGAAGFVSLVVGGFAAFSDTKSDDRLATVGGIGGTLLLGSLWRGGDVTFEEGRAFQTTVAADVTVPVTTAGASAEPRAGEPAVAAVPGTAGGAEGNP